MCKRYAHKYVNNAAMLYSVTFRLRPKPYSITKHFCNLFIHHSMQSLFKKTKKKLIHLTSYENCEVDQWSGLCWVCSNGSATAVQVCHSFSLPLYFSHTHTHRQHISSNTSHSIPDVSPACIDCTFTHSVGLPSGTLIMSELTSSRAKVK